MIRKILKKLTQKQIKKEVEAIQKVKLPPDLQRWVKEYEKVGERDAFLWKWVYKITQITTLPIVSEEYRKSVWKIKTLLVVFDSLLDDIADKEKNGKLLEELIKVAFKQPYIKFDHLNRREKNYLESAMRLWNYILKSIEKYPKYLEFKEIFKYDISQLLNTMEYAYLINKNPYLINKVEHLLYLSANMTTMICYTIDLMCSSFNTQKLRKLREIAWEAQKMARIGNWITTWERELKEDDFTSGVIPYALENNLITVENLRKENKEGIIKKIKESEIEDFLLGEWENSFNKVNKGIKSITSSDLEEIPKSLKKLLIMHLISRGYK